MVKLKKTWIILLIMLLPCGKLIASQQNVPMLKILNLNMIVTEIARALTGSIGLICAIPLTAIITAMLLNKK